MKKFRLTGSSWGDHIGRTVTAYATDIAGQRTWTILEPDELQGNVIDNDHVAFPPPHDFTAEEVGDDDV